MSGDGISVDNHQVLELGLAANLGERTLTRRDCARSSTRRCVEAAPTEPRSKSVSDEHFAAYPIEVRNLRLSACAGG